MKETEKVVFDKLDVKVIKEMPILIDALAATHNKIARFLDPMYDDLKETVRKKISPHKDWKIVKDRKLFCPLTRIYYTTKIVQLENHFALEYYFEIQKVIKGKTKNHLCFQFGYWYERKEEKIVNCFYFQITKLDEYETYGGLLADYSFYKKIKSRINKNIHIEIGHPEKNDASESFYIEVSDLNARKISDTYKIFKTVVVLPVVTKLLRQ